MITSETIDVFPKVASNWWERARGLLGTKSCPKEGLLIRYCRSVHTIGMKYAIDVVYLDDENRVVEVTRNLRPYRLSFGPALAKSCLELPAGSRISAKLENGVQLKIRTNHNA